MDEQEPKLFSEDGIYVEPNPAVEAAAALLRELRAMKTDERSEKNRYLAIAITEAEKLSAFLLCYC